MVTFEITVFLIFMFCREVYSGSLMVDNGEPIINRSIGPLRQINADSGLYIGKAYMDFQR